MDNPKRRKLHILIGDYQDNIGTSVVDQIKLLIKDNIELNIMTTHFAKELLELMITQEIDIFIPILNNIFFPTENLPREKRVKKAMQLISNFRTTYKNPIIALFGWPNDPSFAEKAKKAGANFAFKLPYKPEDFSEAVKKCLDKN